MSVEYTARQSQITPKIRKTVETSLAKISKVLGGEFDAKVVLTQEKHRCRADITISRARRSIAGMGENGDVHVAVGEALDHVERQATKEKERWASTKRRAGKAAVWANGESGSASSGESSPHNQSDGQATDSMAEVNSATDAMPHGKTKTKTAVPFVVHRYGAKPKITEAHLVLSTDKVAMRPLSIEEAVKEAEFRDHDVFVFRDPKGKVMVLHRTREGKMELIEAP